MPPSSIRSTLIELNLHLEFPFVEVRACRECNSTLSDFGLWTLPIRRAFIARRLERRYRRYLEIPDWTTDELLALDESLRAMTIQGLAIRDVTRLRIARAKQEVALPATATRKKTLPVECHVSDRRCLTCGTPTHDDDYCSIACHPEHRSADEDRAIREQKLASTPLTDLERKLARTEQRIAKMKQRMKLL